VAAPGQSDVDLLAVVDRPPGRSEVDDLVRGVIAAHAGVACRLDLRVVTREELCVALDPGAQPGEPDLVIEPVCRARGRALLGAEPSELIGEIPDRWVLRHGDAQLARWQALTDDARHAVLMVLTACRIWRFSEERTYCSKPQAGAWALARDPSLHAVRAAPRQRQGDPARIAPADVGRVLGLARAKRRCRVERRWMIAIVAYDPAWPQRFARLGRQLRGALGDVALRIDHIGSTAVPGLAAKPVIDTDLRRSLRAAGRLPPAARGSRLRLPRRQHRADEAYFREPAGNPRTHIDVRIAGSFSEQFALLFRDYLRTTPELAAEYEALKRRLAERHRNDRHA
jgi:GrpB-like predicted nucleotidyltransferase (UPF0157 family)